MTALQSRSQESKTTKLWVDVLIKPVMLMMLFYRTEKKVDRAPHLRAVGHMIPFFWRAIRNTPAMDSTTFVQLPQCHKVSLRDS